MTDFKKLTDLLIEGDHDDVSSFLITENAIDDVLFKVNGEETVLHYMMNLEEYFDDHDVYLFDGWEDAAVIKKPVISNFWFEVELLLPKNADLRGAKRLIGDKSAQNEIRVKELPSGEKILQIKILKKYLDLIQKNNEDKIKNLLNTKDGMDDEVDEKVDSMIGSDTE